MTNRSNADLVPIATAIGTSWVDEIVRTLRAEDRALIGGWPGTISEAKTRVLSALGERVDPPLLAELARVASEAARRGWQSVTQPDPEP